MRPINKGGSPIHRNEFDEYQDALPYLIKRLGNYCSYCERYFDANLAVEHKSPKEPYRGEERKWKNFLIACTQCNSTKKNKDVDPTKWHDYVWPDLDDTYHMISYLPENAYEARPAKGLSNNDQVRVQRTLDLVKLNANAEEYEEIEYKNRLVKRQEVAKDCEDLKKQYFGAVKMAKEKPNEPYFQKNVQDILENIKRIAKCSGCWSIWMNYFEGVQEVREYLLGYNGTNRQYFS